MKKITDLEIKQELLALSRKDEDERIQKINNIYSLRGLIETTNYSPHKILLKAMELNASEKDIQDICASLGRSKLIEDSLVKSKIASAIRSDQTIAENEKSKLSQAASKNFDFKNKGADQIEEQLNQQTKISNLKKNPLRHVTLVMEKALKLVMTELYLLCGVTNAGKTSLVCYWAARLLASKTKVIIFTNETIAIEFYQRIACLILNNDYSARDKFTQNEIDEIQKKCLELHENKLLYIVDSSDLPTNSISALERVLELCTHEQDQFVLFVDYLQKITTGYGSSDNKTVVLDQVMDLLDSKRHDICGAIVAFSQLYPKTKEKNEFTDRTKWNRSLTDRVDFALEIVRDAKNSSASLILHKERNTGVERGSEFPLIFSRGRYLDPTPDNLKKYGYLMCTDKNGDHVLIKTESEDF